MSDGASHNEDSVNTSTLLNDYIQYDTEKWKRIANQNKPQKPAIPKWPGSMLFTIYTYLTCKEQMHSQLVSRKFYNDIIPLVMYNYPPKFGKVYRKECFNGISELQKWAKKYLFNNIICLGPKEMIKPNRHHRSPSDLKSLLDIADVKEMQKIFYAQQSQIEAINVSFYSEGLLNDGKVFALLDLLKKRSLKEAMVKVFPYSDKASEPNVETVSLTGENSDDNTYPMVTSEDEADTEHKKQLQIVQENENYLYNMMKDQVPIKKLQDLGITLEFLIKDKNKVLCGYSLKILYLKNTPILVIKKGNFGDESQIQS